MIRKEKDDFKTPPIKKLRFRGDLNFDNRIEDLFEDADKRKSRIGDVGNEESYQKGNYNVVTTTLFFINFCLTLFICNQQRNPKLNRNRFSISLKLN